MTKACSKKIFNKCVACVCLTFGTIFSCIAFFMAIGFSMGVMTVSIELPIDLYKSPWKSENWLVQKVFSLKDTKLLVYLP